MRYNIYCDESCHLLNDHKTVMVLGAVSCPNDKARQVSLKLKDLKKQFNFDSNSEIKWNKISTKNAGFYKAVVDYFFDSDFLSFRCIIIDKSKLDHGRFNHDHDTWYYKMYFLLLKRMIDSQNNYQIFLDIKDTKSQAKTDALHQVLCNDRYDFDHKIITSIQTVRSHDTPALQITDLLIGAMGYVHRGLLTSTGKLEVIEHLRRKSGKTLKKQTLVGDSKFNIFVWEPS